MAISSSGCPVWAEFRLETTVRYLIGGQIWDIRSYFGISISEFYRSIWHTNDALNAYFPIELIL